MTLGQYTMFKRKYQKYLQACLLYRYASLDKIVKCFRLNIKQKLQSTNQVPMPNASKSKRFPFWAAPAAGPTGVGIYCVKQMFSSDMVVLKSSYLKMTQPYLTHSFFFHICWEERGRWNLNTR